MFFAAAVMIVDDFDVGVCERRKFGELPPPLRRRVGERGGGEVGA
jgi:hypothetical protein